MEKNYNWINISYSSVFLIFNLIELIKIMFRCTSLQLEGLESGKITNM